MERIKVMQETGKDPWDVDYKENEAKPGEGGSFLDRAKSFSF